MTPLRRSSSNMRCATPAVAIGMRAVMIPRKPAEAYCRAMLDRMNGAARLVTPMTRPVFQTSGLRGKARRVAATNSTTAAAAMMAR